MMSITFPLALSSLWQGPPAHRELALDTNFRPRSASRFRTFAVSTTYSSMHIPKLSLIDPTQYMHCLVRTSHVLAPVPIAAAALTQRARFETLKDGCPKSISVQRFRIASAFKYPPVKLESLESSTSRLASCAPAPVFIKTIFTSECSWTVGRRNRRTPF